MKKFYTLLTLCAAFFGIATASAQIKSVSEFSNTKAYTVKNSRSAWVTNAEALKTINDLKLKEDATDLNQQFAFLTANQGETYYLYSVGQEKFVNNNGALSATPDHEIFFTNGDTEGTFVVYYENGNYINVGGSNQMTVDGWNTPDAGNSNYYYEVADFDPADALDRITAPKFVSSYPELGAIPATTKSLTIAFSENIKAVEAIVLQSSMGELPPMTEEDYYIWDNEVIINLPTQYTAKMQDLTVVLKVLDVNGKYVTYSNHEFFGTVEDMVFLSYTLNPVEPTVEYAGCENGTITTSTKQLEITFNTPIAKVNGVMIQAMWGEFPPMVEGENYTFEDCTLTLNLPAEYIEVAALVPAEYRTLIIGLSVEDIQGKTIKYSNSTLYPAEAAEQMGMTFLQYTVCPVTKVKSISPECGHYDALPTEITIEFDGDVKEIEYGVIRTNLTGFRGAPITSDNYTIEGNKLTLNIPAEYVENQANMQIRMNVVDANGTYVTYAYDTDYEYEGAMILEYTAPLKSDLFEMVAADPAAGEVEKLDVINVTFADSYGTVVGGFDPSKEAYVANAEGEIVSKVSMEPVQEDGWNTNVVKFTLATPVTANGTYTFVIPAATVYNEMFYEYAEDFGVEMMGALYNPEIRIEYVINNSVTGINGVATSAKAEVYTLDGRKVKAGQKLVKGIYVVNGKKVYVK